MSRGLKNRNPLNIRKSADRFVGEVPSTDPCFKQFETMAHGYRAAFRMLNTYRVRHGCRTLIDFINRWAPPSENNTRGYIRCVADRSGVPAGTVIDTLNGEVMRRIVSAMSFVENGIEANPIDVNSGWRLFEKSK